MIDFTSHKAVSMGDMVTDQMAVFSIGLRGFETWDPLIPKRIPLNATMGNIGMLEVHSQSGNPSRTSHDG